MADIAEYTAGKRPEAVALMHRFRDLVLALGDVEERAHKSEVAWARKRVFAAAFILSNRPEVAINLLRTVSHPNLRQAFPTTSRVITYRIYFTQPQEIDEEIAAWVKEAWETVGPGAR